MLTRWILLLGMLVVLVIVGLTLLSRDDIAGDDGLQLPSAVGTGPQPPAIDMNALKAQVKGLNEASHRRAREYDKATGVR